jgi:hypothetical protein
VERDARGRFVSGSSGFDGDALYAVIIAALKEHGLLPRRRALDLVPLDARRLPTLGELIEARA